MCLMEKRENTPRFWENKFHAYVLVYRDNTIRGRNNQHQPQIFCFAIIGIANTIRLFIKCTVIYYAWSRNEVVKGIVSRDWGKLERTPVDRLGFKTATSYFLI